MNEVDPSFLAFLQDEESRSYDGSLLEEVETALKSYNGAPYGDEEDGRSQVVTRDVAEAIDWMVPSIARTMLSTDNIVEFEADAEEDRVHAEAATEKLHDDMRRYSYDLIVCFIKAGLLDKLGLIKTCVEQRKRRVEGVMDTLSLPEGMEGILEASPVEGAVDEFGDPTHFHVAALEDAPAEITDYNVPLEEFRFSPDTRDLDTSPYLAHVCEKSLSDLIEMGFDRETVETVQGDNPNTSLAYARNDQRSDMGTDRTGVLRKVWLTEEYAYYDLNGDGIAERLCVSRVGNTILTRDGQLAIHEVDYQPFGWWTPFQMPGRLVGQSLADKVIDIQRQTTVLKRNALDSLYFSTAPGTYIHEDSIGDHTIDDLLTVRPGRLVRFAGTVPPVPEHRNDTSATAFEAIERLRGEAESRTGITRLNQGLDADAINKTMGGTAMMQAAGQLIEDYLARNVANAVARWFCLKYKLMREHGSPFTIRVDGEYKQIDPKQWPEDIDIKVRVGLGSGRKDQRLAYRRELGRYQAMLKEVGSPLVNDEVAYKNLAGLARDMGFQPNELFVDPSTVQQPQEQQPDPEMMKAQAELQMQQQKHEADVQLKGADLQAKQEEAQMKLQIMRETAMEQASLAREKAEFEREQAISQMLFEREMRQREFEHSAQMAKYTADQKAKQYRDGGDLSK